MSWILAPLQRLALILLGILAIAFVGFLYGGHLERVHFAAVQLQQKVRDLTVINTASQIDSLKLVEQQTVIADLNKEIANARAKVTDKDHICFEPGDTDQLLNIWQH